MNLRFPKKERLKSEELNQLSQMNPEMKGVFVRKLGGETRLKR